MKLLFLIAWSLKSMAKRAGDIGHCFHVRWNQRALSLSLRDERTRGIGRLYAMPAHYDNGIEG